MLTRTSNHPLGVSLFVMCDPELRQWVLERSGSKGVPGALQGTALEASSWNALPALLETAFLPETQGRIYQRILDVIPDPRGAAFRAVEEILSSFTAQPGRHRQGA